jgi:hypothetical protein
MQFERAAEFWIDNVLFGPLELTYRMLDWVESHAGPFAAFTLLLLLVPPMGAALILTLLLTGLALALLALAAPITLPIAIYRYRRTRRR